MKKRRHHHVWQHYLKPWERAGTVQCSMAGRIFGTDRVNIAVERDFYALPKWTADDRKLMRAFISPMPEAARRTHMNFLAALEFPDRFEGHSEIADDQIAIFRTNAIEDQYAAIEQCFEPLLTRILTEDLGFYDDARESIAFLAFLCSQQMRTKGVKERSLELNRSASLPNLERIWPALAYILAVNIGGTMYVERRRRTLVLLNNGHDTPFITGDQPVVNLLGMAGTVTDRVALYFPVSPRLALVLNDVDNNLPLSSASLTPTDVRALNAKIAAETHAQVFGNSDAALLQAHEDSPWQA
ncbi:MAG: DUF4238 domain-containing protein [Paraburkholderia sp.]|jgi:hypothetical protein